MTIDQLHNTTVKTRIKALLLLLVSYFFLGMTEGSFIWFPNTQDALINFFFTLICVGSSWVLFKLLYYQFQEWHQAVQSAAIIITLCIYITLINWVYIELLWSESLGNTPFFNIVLPLALPLFMSWTLGYTWLLNRMQQQEKQTSATQFLVHMGKRKVLYPITNTAGFTIANKLVFLVSTEGKKYHIENSLNELEKQLEDKGFFRANRQLLIARGAVKSFFSGNNDKIKIDLTEGFGPAETHSVSRYKAAKFRMWIKTYPPLSS